MADHRLAVWDAALDAVRSYLRGAGLLEVSTPFIVPAVAVEPFIEPVVVGAGADRHFVITSPELAMKRLVCRHHHDVFQIAHVRRAGERSDRHREEFHLVEWYRVGATLGTLQADVAALCRRVAAAVAGVQGRTTPPEPRWETHRFFDLLETTTGVDLRGADDPGTLLQSLRSAAGLSGDTVAAADLGVSQLARWTECFSLWSDQHLDAWLRDRPGVAVHLEAFPPALAALAQVDRRAAPAFAHRFESHLGGIEVANGYLELRDAEEQRRRFERVNALRERHGLETLPLDEAFLADLEHPGLPSCVGVALGLDRLVMLAAGAHRLDDIDPLG